MGNAESPTEGTDAETAPAADPPPAPHEGGSRELLALATPLIISQSFMTVQVFIDRVMLSWHDPDEMAAAFPAVMWYWLGFGFLSVTAGYTATFVAQYVGAGRPHRVGPAVWQGIYFAVAAGLLFLLVHPAAGWLISLGGHTDHLQRLETAYLRTITWAALPMLVMHAVNGFFSGRGRTWAVLGIEGFGTAVNIGVAQLLIFGRWGFPELGIEGAGWAMVAGSWASGLLGLGLFLRRRYRAEFATLAGWRFEGGLFGRLMWYGGPAGLQVFLDVLVFHLFILMVGRMGPAEAGAASLTITLNMLAFLPLMGLGQAVCVLVGRRLGEDRPEVAERTVHTGLRLAVGTMAAVAVVYVAFPHQLLAVFGGYADPDKFAAIAAVVPPLLVCVALYCVADAASVTFAFALRGAGDTWFVTWLTFVLAWPIMVVPTYFIVLYGYGILWAWGSATAFIGAMALCFGLRFRSGVWKTKRVIEPGVVESG